MTSKTTPLFVRPSVVVTLLVLLGTVVFMTVFLGSYTLLGVGAPYMGVLFLLYWAAMLHMDFSVYLPSAIGAVLGTVLAWMLIALPERAGAMGTAIAYGALGAVLFCYTRRQARLLFNDATLLFVLVATIPELRVNQNVVQMVLSVLFAIVFMGVAARLIIFARRFRNARDTRSNL